MPKSIFCLFSEDSNYDQPPFNLVCWWSEKPSLETMAGAMGLTFPGRCDSETMFLVHVWSKGKEGAIDGQIGSHQTKWTLVAVPEGKPLGD